MGVAKFWSGLYFKRYLCLSEFITISSTPILNATNC